MIPVSANTCGHCQAQHASLVCLGPMSTVARCQHRGISPALCKPKAVQSNGLPYLCHSTIHVRLMIIHYWVKVEEKQANNQKPTPSHPGKLFLCFLSFCLFVCLSWGFVFLWGFVLLLFFFDFFLFSFLFSQEMWKCESPCSLCYFSRRTHTGSWNTTYAPPEGD